MTAPTFDATPGSATGTSYASVNDAAAYLAVRPGGASAWDGAADDARELALMTATSILEREAWVGVRAAEEQRLAWPRRGIDNTGSALPLLYVPGGVQNAAAEIALALLVNNVDPTTPTGVNALGSVKSITAGPVKLDFGANAVSVSAPGSSLPRVVQLLVSAYLRSTTAPVGATASALRVVRAS